MTSFDNNKVIIIVVANIRNPCKNGGVYPEVLEHFIRTRKQRRLLSDAGQPKVDFLHSWASSLLNFLSKSSL